ncbi:uncharacterized protein L203_102653 [Cryptococcus depauperatus CBS 7841]|uniref:Uncharacterized protein n=1 Tax=Cryptococcus depauperatus CBS 7841 TaxID=1295531 RepID=A0A1E3IE35_9TREE|nr:hypothetical protein L203_04018 [Cryptococcus depauperatus CBS 7841]
MDARSLLRAKKAEAKIVHPYASYTAAGSLRCSICSVPVKQWDAHLLTKQHRVSAAREKAEKEKMERAKRPRQETTAEGSSKRQRIHPEVEEDEGQPSQLPSGFFSAKNKPADTDDVIKLEASPVDVAAPPAKTGDTELDDFLASLEETTPAPTTSAPTSIASKRRLASYKAVDDEIVGQAVYQAAPVMNAPATKEQDVKMEEEPEETEAERRERLAREEREEIMARLEEEERAQEDADLRVMALKQRMEMIKKRKEAREGTKSKDKSAITNGI